MELHLLFSAWQSANDVTPYQLEEVWIHISGVPHAWRHYLAFWALGTVIGATLEVDMLTCTKKGVIRVHVGVLDKRRLPLTTDLVFGTEGYNITFTLEDPSFVPASPPPDSHDPMGRDGNGDDKGGATEKEPESASKKLKSVPTAPSSEKGSADGKEVSGPTPMQTCIAVTPLGNKRPCPPR